MLAILPALCATISAVAANSGARTLVTFSTTLRRCDFGIEETPLWEEVVLRLPVQESPGTVGSAKRWIVRVS